MEPRERRTLFLPKDVDHRIAQIAARNGHAVGTQMRAMLVAAVERSDGNGRAEPADDATIAAALTRLEQLLERTLRVVRVHGATQVEILGGLRAVLHQLAEASIDPHHRTRWAQHLERIRRAEVEAIFLDLHGKLGEDR